jgi:Metallo-beta-lactamase superfamily
LARFGYPHLDWRGSRIGWVGEQGETGLVSLVRMETAVPGLYASAPEPLPFAPSLDIRAFLLQRDQGNLLVYSVSDLESEVTSIHDLGGISRQYLNHRHEAAFASDWVTAPLFVHQNESESVAEQADVGGTFSRRHMLDDDFEVIPTPGHTSGATAYLWDSGAHRFLFTGDTLYLSDGEWVAAVLGSSDRVPYLESLELIRELDFDVLVPWAASGGQPYHAVTSQAENRRRIDAVIERVWRGGDH